jgi:hypothetical protein
MAAAAAHLAAQAQPAQAQAPTRKPVAPERISFWDRIRARWAFPTFATVGALAVFLVANRVFMNPERALERARPAAVPEAPVQPPEAPAARVAAPRGLEETSEGGGAKATELDKSAATASAPADGERKAPLLAEPVGRRGDDARAGGGKDTAKQGEMRELSKAKKKGEDPMARFAPEPPAAAPVAAKPSRDEGLGRQFAPPPPPRESQAVPRLSKEADRPLMAEEAQMDSATTRSAPRAHRAGKAAMDDLASTGDAEKSVADRSGAGPGVAGGMAGVKNKPDSFGSGAAQAAPVVAQSQPAKVPAPRPSAPAAAPSMAPPPPASPPPAPQQKLRARSEVAADEGGWPAQDLDAKSERKQASNKGSAGETLLQRADRLFAEGRWTEAAAAYRELLRRDPRSDDAERWRRRLVAAESAEANERNASLARRKAADANQQRNAEAEAAPASRAKQAPAKADKAEKRAAPATSE